MKKAGGGCALSNWEKAFQDYTDGMKYKDIAEKYDVSINTVKSWKSRKWNDMQGATKTKKVAHKKEKVAHKAEPRLVIDNDELTEQQRVFCLLYLRYFNATKAYQEAYQVNYKSAQSNSYRLMANDGIKKELTRLKAELQSDIFLDIKDLIREYAKQAFADINDFLEFRVVEEPMINMFGEKVRDPETDEVVMKRRNIVEFKDSSEVDGTLIQEVKMGKDGASLKLMDKQRAMGALMKYLEGDDLLKAQIEKIKIETERAKAGMGIDEEDGQDDGFLDALTAEGAELWPEE